MKIINSEKQWTTENEQEEILDTCLFIFFS